VCVIYTYDCRLRSAWLQLMIEWTESSCDGCCLRCCSVASREYVAALVMLIYEELNKACGRDENVSLVEI
jgi:hypothetical protein